MSHQTAKTDLKRRQFLLALAASSVSWRVGARKKTRVVVVGGGVGGLCTFTQLNKTLPASQFELLLIEPQSGYTPPFCEQAAFATPKSDNLTHHRPFPASLRQDQIQASVENIKPGQKVLTLSDGQVIDYDYLVLAPGLAAATDSIAPQTPGWFNDQSLLGLLQKIDALKAGSDIALGVPHLPYRCPPAPYQRASLIYARLQSLGIKNCHITIVDDKNRFSLQAHFLKYWEQHTGGAIEWVAGDIHEGITAYTDQAIETEFGDFEADLIVPLGPQQAPNWCQKAGLTDFTGFCPVNIGSMLSTQQPDIYILGDAAKASPMPKAASSAYMHAQIASQHLLTRFGYEGKQTKQWSTQCFAFGSFDHAFFSRQDFTLESAGGVRQQQETFSHWPLEAQALKQETRRAKQWQDALLSSMGLQAIRTNS